MNRAQDRQRKRAPLWRVVSWLLLLPGLAPVMTWSQVLNDDPPLLAAQDAFGFTAVPRGPLVRIEARVEDGYYLYRDRIRIESRTPGVKLGEALMPAGINKDDPLFGQVQVYRGLTLIDIPLLVAPPAGEALDLAITSQGCADLGVCYPPDVRILRVPAGAAFNVVRGAMAGLAADQTPGLVRLAASSSASATRNVLDRLGQAFGDAASEGATADGVFLPVDEAFALRTPRFDRNTAIVAFDIAPGYYLYRSRMGFEVVSPQDVQLAPAQLPEGKPKHDAYFGEQQVYYQRVQMRVPVAAMASVSTLQLKVLYQGCADAGLCYPPQERVIPVQMNVAPSVPGRDALLSAPATGALSETDQLALSISNDALALVLGTFFIAGLLLAFTPCVLPMIPILSAIIAGQQDSPHAKSSFALSLVYVLSMSGTYTAAGVTAGLFGQNLQALFQHPALLIGFSAVFVMLALAMFGLYELQIPVALQNRLAAFSHRQRGGSFLGVGTMGVLSALIVGPCVAAPLAAALIVIGTAGDPLRGGLALFALSLGMGVPLLVVGAFGPRFLPRAGPWMIAVKQLFGVMLLAVAIYLLARILTDAVVLTLWSALALLSAVLVFRFGAGSGPQDATRARPRTAMRIALSLGVAAYAAALAIGAASGANDPLHPLASLLGPRHSSLQFERVKSVADVDRVVAQANEDGRIVMLDFYADWCVSCIEMERETFVNPAVHVALRDAVLIQADVTIYDEEDKALLERFGLHGPPAILFFGVDGRELREFRVIGFMAADAFRSHVSRAGRS